MKNKIESQLKKIAQSIIDESFEDSKQLKLKVRELYEKLTILSFTEENLEAFQNDNSQEDKKPMQRRVIATSKKAVAQKMPIDEVDNYLPDGTEYNDSEVTEPNTEKIKDIVAQMPIETQAMDSLFDEIQPKKAPTPAPQQPRKPEPKADTPQKDFRDIGVDYDNLPNFEPLNNHIQKSKPKSINDRLKKGINIGLNERLTFIKHLFEGNANDYNRVVSQLNTFDSLEESKKFVELVVKPDYNNWIGKEDYEKRFITRVENKFE